MQLRFGADARLPAVAARRARRSGALSLRHIWAQRHAARGREQRQRRGGLPIRRPQPVCVNLSKESMAKPELLRRHVSKREFRMASQALGRT
jgi:hypothetical protein